MVERLSDATSVKTRIVAYRAKGETGVLHTDAASCLFTHAAPWVQPQAMLEEPQGEGE